MKTPKVIIQYNGKDITEDLSMHLLSVDYDDKSEGASDEIAITLEDVDGLWKSSWYPTKGDTLTVLLGYEGELVNCGTFDIDEVDLSGPPDIVSIRGLASGIKKTLRTNKSKAFDEQTLRQIAEKVASENGLTVEGNIPNVRFARVTQHRETDLAFLKRISYEYGCVFSVRDKKLVFTNIYDLEKTQPSLSIDRTDLTSYSLRDKTSDTYKNAQVRYHNPDDKKVAEAKTSDTGLGFDSATSDNSLELRTKAENKGQAEAKAKAALYRANSRQQEGSISLPGNPLMVAGNAFELTGLGVLSGKYTILSSSHRVTRGGGYTTDCEIKKVASVPREKQTPKKPTTGQGSIPLGETKFTNFATSGDAFN